MRSANAGLLIAVAVFLVIALAACDSDSSDLGQIDPNTGFSKLDPSRATLEQIIERSRAAMGKVTAYKTRATLVTENSRDQTAREMFGTLNNPRRYGPRESQITQEWQSPNRYFTRSELTDARFGDLITNESIIIGDQLFSRFNETEWIQAETPPSPWPEIVHSSHILVLDASDMKLVSSDEETEDGRKVYHLEFSVNPFAALYEQQFAESESEGFFDPPEYPKVVDSFVTTLLIDHETFRIVRKVGDGRNETVHDPVEGMLNAVDEWSTSYTSIEYYDYNVPNVIEEPAEFTKYNIGYNSAVITRFDESRSPARFDCSDSPDAWPNCVITNPDDVEVALATFPDESKIVIDEDIVISFAYVQSPPIDWNAHAFIWHKSSATVIQLCYSQTVGIGETANSRSEAFRLNLAGGNNKTPESTAQLQEIRDNKELMEQIRLRIGEVKAKCVFSN